MRYPVSFVLIFLLTCTLSAQDYPQLYANAKDLYMQGRYSLAMESFKPLMVYDRENPYTEYASFYYALAAYHQGYPAVAKDMLLQVRKLYPDWKQLPETDYWLAKLYFDERQYFQALNVLQRNGNNFGEQAIIMKQHYLQEVEDVETLRMMLEEYPEDKVIGTRLVKAILAKPYLQQDHKLLDSMITRFQLNDAAFVVEAFPENKFKEKYRVAVLFPFLAESLEPKVEQKRINQFFLDIYLGMRLANDTLAAKGIQIELMAYDTERDSLTTKRLLELPELREMDLLVGPHFQNQVAPVRAFSTNHKINMISPVSGNAEYLGENPFALLFPPSYETVGSKSAELLDSRIKNKNIVVFFGDTQKDTVTAASFVRRAKELGLNITHTQVVNRETAAQINKYLATPTEFDEFKVPTEFSLKKDSIGGIFVASDDPLIYTKAISGVDARGDSIILVGNESWLENQAINYETYERLHIVMAAPTYSNLASQEYQTFRKAYIKRHGQLPNTYARIGFEFIWFVGHALHQYGLYFQTGLSEAGFTKGFLMPGTNFEGARDNQAVPFIHFRQGQLVLLDLR